MDRGKNASRFFSRGIHLQCSFLLVGFFDASTPLWTSSMRVFCASSFSLSSDRLSTSTIASRRPLPYLPCICAVSHAGRILWMTFLIVITDWKVEGFWIPPLLCDFYRTSSFSFGLTPFRFMTPPTHTDSYTLLDACVFRLASFHVIHGQCTWPNLSHVYARNDLDDLWVIPVFVPFCQPAPRLSTWGVDDDGGGGDSLPSRYALDGHHACGEFSSHLFILDITLCYVSMRNGIRYPFSTRLDT